MSKKNVYLVQVGFAFDKSLYVPYAVGALAAYALRDEVIRSDYSFRDFIFRREPLDEVVARLDEPYLIGFSCCVWNFEYNKALARRVKAAYPSCTVVFGGHNVPDDASLLAEESAVDILIHGEGEDPFSRLLRTLPGGDIHTVPGISYRDNRGLTVTTPQTEQPDIAEYPSPYLTGMFDRLLTDNPDVEFLAVTETNRGCPYRCSYCDWCAGKTVRFFPMERVKAEFAWLSENKIEYCFCADANFGMFPRDLEIVDFLVNLKTTTGYPNVFRPCYAKNSDENVFHISRKLNLVGMDKGATLAYQTLSDDALVNVRRKNLTLDKFANLLAKYNDAGIPSYSELILGLPGETYESFCRGICELLEAGQHNSISVYHCEVLVNSELAQKDYAEKHGLVTAKVPFNHIHSADIAEEVTEYSYLIIGTNTLSNTMWVKANLFSVCVQCFHNLGLLRCFALYQYYEQGMRYLEFYNRLSVFIEETKDTLVHTLFERFENALKDSVTGKWMYQNPLYGDASWFFEEGAFLEILQDYPRFWREITPFLNALGIPQPLYADLIQYQKAIVNRPFTDATALELEHDLRTYFAHIYSGKTAPVLTKKKNVLRIAPGSTAVSWQEYARETVWYGRRRGATLHSSNHTATRVEYIPE